MRVLFVCMGNICRSPTAEGVFRKLLEGHPDLAAIDFDSAGTHGYHAGHPPDRRAIAAAKRRGIDISDLKARPVDTSDFEAFDLILAMDEDNLADLRTMSREQHHGKIRLLMSYADSSHLMSVPDPYYGGSVGFERVLDLLEAAMRGLLEELSSVRAESKK